jgi:hypothetical protein
MIVRTYQIAASRVLSGCNEAHPVRIDGGRHGPEVLQKQIVGGVKRASGGLAHVGVSAFGVLTLAVSVTFMTLFL